MSAQKLVTLDAADALKVPGVETVVQAGSGVAVVAKHFWAAKLGRDALRAEWSTPEGDGVNTERLLAELHALSGKAGITLLDTGKVQETLDAAASTLEVVWTREDDMRGGYYRPAFVQRVQAGIGEDGMPVAWHHVVAGQSIIAGSPFEQVSRNKEIDDSSVEAIASSPYIQDIQAKQSRCTLRRRRSP